MRISSTSMGAHKPSPREEGAPDAGFAVRLERAHRKTSRGDPPEPSSSEAPDAFEAPSPTRERDESEASTPPDESPEPAESDAEEPEALERDASPALLELGRPLEITGRAPQARPLAAGRPTARGGLARPGLTGLEALAARPLVGAPAGLRVELRGALSRAGLVRALPVEPSALEGFELMGRARSTGAAASESASTLEPDTPARPERAATSAEAGRQDPKGGARPRAGQGGASGKNLPGQAAEAPRPGENFPPTRPGLGGREAPGRARGGEALDRLHLVVGRAPGGAAGVSGGATLRGALERAGAPRRLAHKVQVLRGEQRPTAQAVVELGSGRQVELRVRQHRGVMTVSLEASSAELAHQLGQHLRELTRALESTPTGRGRLELDGAVVAEWTGRSGAESHSDGRRHAASLHEAARSGGGAASEGAGGAEAEVLETVQRVLTTGTLHIVT